MDKKYKIILGVLGGVFVLIVLGLVVSGMLQPSQSTLPIQNGEELPEYTLSTAEEDYVREFVKNFVFLYNTYDYTDFSNLTALGDYQTLQMQEHTAELVAELETKTPSGYFQSTEVDIGTFSYLYPSAETLEASVSATITSGTNSGQYSARADNGQKIKTVTVHLRLQRSGLNWFVDSQEIE